MKKVLVFVGLCILLSITTFAQTYYYERVAIVTNGVKSSDSGDGHFITFTSKGCYDSDKKGFDEKFGFRTYLSTNNDIKSYYGDSYFGKAYYYFSSDFNRLNIKIESSGVIYVYNKTNAPTGLMCSNRKHVKESVPTTMPIIVTTTPTPSPSPSITPSYPTTTRSTRSSGRKCTGCNGTGYCSMCKGKGWYKYIYDGNIYDCPACHSSGLCGVCFGKGNID